MEARKKAASLGTQGGGKPGDDQITQPIPKAQPEPGKEDNTEEMIEIPIAGRTKMQVSKNGNDATKQTEKEPENKEVEDQGDAKAELNSILKRSPGKLSSGVDFSASLLMLFSHHLLQIILSLQ